MARKKEKSTPTDYIGSARILFTKILNDLGGELREKPKPLSKNAEIVYNILTALPSHKALTAPEILDEVANRHKKYWDEKELYDRIFPQLKPWGLTNKPRVGYRIEKEKSADAPS